MQNTHTKEIQRRQRDRREEQFICIFQDGILQDCISVAGAALEEEKRCYRVTAPFLTIKKLRAEGAVSAKPFNRFNNQSNPVLLC